MRTISRKVGGVFGGGCFCVIWDTDFHSETSNTASQLRSGNSRPIRITNIVRHEMTSATAR